jgi:hypothetical protein
MPALATTMSGIGDNDVDAREALSRRRHGRVDAGTVPARRGWLGQDSRRELLLVEER